MQRLWAALLTRFGGRWQVPRLGCLMRCRSLGRSWVRLAKGSPKGTGPWANHRGRDRQAARDRVGSWHLETWASIPASRVPVATASAASRASSAATRSNSSGSAPSSAHDAHFRRHGPDAAGGPSSGGARAVVSALGLGAPAPDWMTSHAVRSRPRAVLTQFLRAAAVTVMQQQPGPRMPDLRPLQTDMTRDPARPAACAISGQTASMSSRTRLWTGMLPGTVRMPWRCAVPTAGAR